MLVGAASPLLSRSLVILPDVQSKSGSLNDLSDALYHCEHSSSFSIALYRLTEVSPSATYGFRLERRVFSLDTPTEKRHSISNRGSSQSA